MDFAAWFASSSRGFSFYLRGEEAARRAVRTIVRRIYRWCRAAVVLVHSAIERGNERGITKRRGNEASPPQWWITVVLSKETSNSATARRWVDYRHAVRFARSFACVTKCPPIADENNFHSISIRRDAIHLAWGRILRIRELSPWHLRVCTRARRVARLIDVNSRFKHSYHIRRRITWASRSPLVHAENYVTITGAVVACIYVYFTQCRQLVPRYTRCSARKGHNNNWIGDCRTSFLTMWNVIWGNLVK